MRTEHGSENRMIFFNSPNPAPNPRRVRIFAAEKGITLPTRDLSIPAREHKAADFVEIGRAHV